MSRADRPTPDEGCEDSDALIDARGLLCPVPVIRLARVARTLSPDCAIRVLADDPAARADIPAWCRMKGHTVTVTEEADHTAYDVRLGS